MTMNQDLREYAQSVVTNCINALVAYLGRAPNERERNLLAAAIAQHLQEKQASTPKAEDLITALEGLADAARSATERYADQLMADADVDAAAIPAKLEAFVEKELMPIADKAVDIVEEYIAPIKATKH